MKTSQTIEAAANLKGMAKHTHNRVMSAIAEDTTAAMLDAFAALTDGAKAIALQSGKFSNLYIRGERKAIAAEEAAKELTERAAACVSRKLRKIDMICAVAFLTEYIARQRKAIETPETHNPDNTPSTMNAKEIVASLNESQIRRACAALLPTKFFDEHFTPERGNIALLRQILEDHVFEYDTTAAEIIEAAGADETATETKAPEFSELSHAGHCLCKYLQKDSFIYEYYTQKAIEAIVNDGLSVSSEDVRRYIRNAIDRASWQVEKYDHMTPTAQDIEHVTRNYAAYIVDCAKYEIENA